jgi:4-alpha-glucanotransferase
MEQQKASPKRQAGVLMPVASLPGPYGIGDFGPTSRQFVDQLAAAGVKVWQILPLNPLGYGNSPYQPYSSYAGDILYISPEILYQQNLLEQCPAPQGEGSQTVDYAAMRTFKESLCRTAFARFQPNADYEIFCAQPWVYTYAVFLTFKKKNNLICWNDWPAAQKNWPQNKSDVDLSPYEEDIRYEMFVQYLFYTQWMALKRYANEKGIRIMGDVPIYVGQDSQDVWAGRENFMLTEDGYPTVVAGVPPDYFSPTGQRWGNPIYNWDYMADTGFTFWIERLRYSAQLFDIVRIDHFRAFDTYWEIPASEPTAENGVWREAPGYACFDAILKALPNIDLVAEDLGDLRPEVYVLRDAYGFKGMRIVQFTFEPGEMEKQTGDKENLIVYTGTHDNQTILGWYQAKTLPQRIAACRELRRLGFREGTVPQRFVAYALGHKAELAVIPVQDIMGLDDHARLNTPGTVGSPNWEWRLPSLQQLAPAMQFFAQQIKSSNR